MEIVYIITILFHPKCSGVTREIPSISLLTQPQSPRKEAYSRNTGISRAYNGGAKHVVPVI
jgi:hypothetical protein